MTTTVQPLSPTLDGGGDAAPAPGPASGGQAVAPAEESLLGDHAQKKVYLATMEPHVRDEARSVR